MKTAIITSESSEKHITGDGHPEQPKRVVSIIDTLEKYRAIRQKQKEYANQGGKFTNNQNDSSSSSSDDDSSPNNISLERKRKKNKKKRVLKGLSNGDTMLHLLARMNIDQDASLDDEEEEKANTKTTTALRSVRRPPKKSVTRTSEYDSIRLKKPDEFTDQDKAVQKNRFQFMYNLIDYLINDEAIHLNKRNDQGYTALHVAASDKTISGFENSLFVKALVAWTHGARNREKNPVFQV